MDQTAASVAALAMDEQTDGQNQEQQATMWLKEEFDYTRPRRGEIREATILDIGENDIIATFHTHPNTGSNYLQEPGETDRRAVCDDPDLKGMAYVGEFVISQATIYLIAPSGQVREMGNTREVLGER